MQNQASNEEFIRLLEPIRDALYRYALRSCWRADQGADATQEAVMVAWREFSRFEPGTNFRAWMFKILSNTVLRYNKRIARGREYAMSDGSVNVEAILERETAWDALLDDPERLRQLLDERLVRALDRLAPGERQCFLLRLMEDFSYKEIASMLEIPLGTVMSNIHRARMKLREQLAALGAEYGLAGRSE